MNESCEKKQELSPERQGKIEKIVSPLQGKNGSYDPEAQRHLDRLQQMSLRFQRLEEEQGGIYACILEFEQRLKAVQAAW